jgi:glycosyltransferase involved in cell wall biosynthesis
MKIDYYTLGNPSDPMAWSGTYFELTNALNNLGVSQGAYDIKPERLTSIKQQDTMIDKAKYIFNSLRYFRYYEGKIYLSSEYHPDILERSREIAYQIYKNHPHPDVIIADGEYAVFDETPFFIYHDLDMRTLLDWRRNGKKNYMCDHLPTAILRKRLDHQKDAYARARGLLISSEWIGNSLKSYIDSPEKVYVVGMGHNYNPITLSESMLEERFENPRLLFVGRDGFRKGIDIVLSAFDIFKEELPEARLSIVTDLRDTPRSVKKDLGRMSQNIEAISTGISHERLSDLYLRSSLFIMPSRFEAWGKVFFEAMAFGQPVIGAKNCAMPEFIKDDYNGYTASYNAGKIADRILSIFNSFDKYKTMSENALKVSEMYTWEKIAKHMAEIMERNI